MIRKLKAQTIKQREIVRKIRMTIHKPTQMEKDKRRGRGKERQKIKVKLRKNGND